MIGSETIENVVPGGLLEACQEAKTKGMRLVHITCARLATGELEVTYGMDKDFDSLLLRVTVAEGGKIASVTPLFPGAYLYENEIHELYGLEIRGIEPDFKGNFYQVGEKRHFNPATVASESGMARVVPTIKPITDEKKAD